MTVLHLVPLHGALIEPALARCDAAILARRPDGAFADIAETEVPGFIRRCAFAGVAAQPAAAAIVPPDRCHPAVGRDLAPLRVVGLDLDTVRVRRLSLGEATRAILARRWSFVRPPTRVARDRCRRLLRGEDVAFAWTRSAWATRSALHGPEVRSSLRPVVFDRSALGDGSPGRIVFARDGLLGRWLFA